MSTIKIKDLTDSIDLDRQAMRAIAGGARLRGRQPLQQTPGTRIVSYPGSPGLLRPGAEATGKSRK